MAVLGIKAEGCAKDTLHVFLVVGNALIFIISLLGLILSCTTAKAYRSEYDKEFFINIKDFEDLQRVCTILEQFSVIIHFSTKGDVPTLEIYDGWRE